MATKSRANNGSSNDSTTVNPNPEGGETTQNTSDTSKGQQADYRAIAEMTPDEIRRRAIAKEATQAAYQDAQIYVGVRDQTYQALIGRGIVNIACESLEGVESAPQVDIENYLPENIGEQRLAIAPANILTNLLPGGNE